MVAAQIPACLPPVKITEEVQRFIMAVATEIFDAIEFDITAEAKLQQYRLFSRRFGRFREDLMVDAWQRSSNTADNAIVAARLKSTPDISTIYNFLVFLLEEFKLSKVRFICTLVYLKKFIEASECPLYSTTWRPIFLACYILGHKMEDDEVYIASEFADAYALINPEQLMLLELSAFAIIGCSAYISSDVYSIFARRIQDVMEQQEVHWADLKAKQQMEQQRKAAPASASVPSPSASPSPTSVLDNAKAKLKRVPSLKRLKKSKSEGRHSSATPKSVVALPSLTPPFNKSHSFTPSSSSTSTPTTFRSSAHLSGIYTSGTSVPLPPPKKIQLGAISIRPLR